MIETKKIEVPEFLKGKEVQKFENEIDRSCYDIIYVMTSEDDYDKDADFSEEALLMLKDFYTQPFIRDMPEKYFADIAENEFIYSNKDGHQIDCSDFVENGWLFTAKRENLSTWTPFHKIKTLSDFIDACFNSDIKLTWRK